MEAPTLSRPQQNRLSQPCCREHRDDKTCANVPVPTETCAHSKLKFAVTVFPGFADQSKYEAHEAQLKASLSKAGEKIISDEWGVVWAAYDSPFTVRGSFVSKYHQHNIDAYMHDMARNLADSLTVMFALLVTAVQPPQRGVGPHRLSATFPVFRQTKLDSPSLLRERADVLLFWLNAHYFCVDGRQPGCRD